jgi:hypothetical protein
VGIRSFDVVPDNSKLFLSIEVTGHTFRQVLSPFSELGLELQTYAQDIAGDYGMPERSPVIGTSPMSLGKLLVSFRMKGEIGQRCVGSGSHKLEIALSQFPARFEELLLLMYSLMMSDRLAKRTVVVKDRTELGGVRSESFLPIMIVFAGWFLHFGTIRNVVLGSATAAAQGRQGVPDLPIKLRPGWERNGVRSKEPEIDSLSHNLRLL